MLNDKLKKLSVLFRGKKIYLAVAIGFIGIFLIFISTFFSKSTSENYSSDGIDINEYKASLESNLKETVKSITGDDDIKIVITLDTGVEKIYASETKTEEQSDGENGKNKKDLSSEKKYLTVKNTDGTETPLTVTEIMPTVRGAVIVCKADGEQTIDQITKAASTALDISEDKIYVTNKSIEED